MSVKKHMMPTFRKILKRNYLTVENEKLCCLELAVYLADTMPILKKELTPKQKRVLIRNHVGDITRFSQFSKYRLNEYYIYSLTCQKIALHYGLNDP